MKFKILPLYKHCTIIVLLIYTYQQLLKYLDNLLYVAFVNNETVREKNPREKISSTTEKEFHVDFLKLLFKSDPFIILSLRNPI